MFFNNYYYYISIALQALCVWHCIKKGNQQKWIWIIVFLSFIGCVAYFFSEIVTGSEMNRLGSGLSTVVNPGGGVRKLQQRLTFADTFENRIALADAYLAAGETEKAIHLYEQSLKGVFAENEHGVMQLMMAYEKVGRYKDILPLARLAKSSPQFARSKAHIAYANALAKTGQAVAAEKEFESMKGRFSAFEPRYHYGLFLLDTDRKEEARNLFAEVLHEEKHLSSRERRFHRQWFTKSREELKKMAG